MTGFGEAERQLAAGRLRVEIRSVNHRFLLFTPRLASDLAAFESAIKDRVRQEFERGHVSLSARWVEGDSAEPALSINLDRARQFASRLKELQTELSLSGEVGLDLVARQPEVLVWSQPDAEPVTWEDIEPVVGEAAAACRAMRLREGAALEADIRSRLESISGALDSISQLAPARLVRERDRLSTSVQELMGAAGIDPQRLAQEIALMADRLDISEELVRFRTHIEACRQAFASDAPVGKQLGFLAQEMGREANTIGSKANDAGIATLVIQVKGDLEKIREQLENLE